MSTTGTHGRKWFATAVFFLGSMVGAAYAAASTADDTQQLFARADYIKVIDNAVYVKLIQQLEQRQDSLSDIEKWHLRFLEAFQTAYIGQNEKARAQLENVINHAPDAMLKVQAKATLINILGVGHHYEEAFTYLDQALDELPQINDKAVRMHILGEAAQLMIEAGQYDLAINYADEMIPPPTFRNYNCEGMAIKLLAELRKGLQTDELQSQGQQGVNACLAISDYLSTYTIRRDLASIAIQKGKLDDAIALLQNNYADVLKLQYPDLASEYTVLLAEAYWKQQNTGQAEKYATATVDIASKGEFAEPLSKAYHLLYEIAREKGNLRDALAFHEKYMVADNGHLDDVREKALAYQIVKQQVDAKKAELDELGKQNQILQLHQALDHKAMENSRLYIALLLTVLASIAFWLYRLKRSQLRFMRMARRDGLTGIFNRQHFVDEAEQVLRNASKSMRCASLLLIDLDHFKVINDTHGHNTGDQVLRRAVDICRAHLHSADVFGRLGGEEFGILLPECTAELAIERAEQIRLAICADPDEESDDIPVSASLGIASTAHHGHALRSLLIAADEALYRAKRDGRNRVVINISTVTVSTKVNHSTHVGAAPHIPETGKPFNYANEK